MAQKSPVMQSLKAVGAVISVRSLSSGPGAVASLPHHSWDREPLLRLGLWPNNVLGSQQRPKNQTPKEEETKRALLFLSNILKCPTKLNLGTS